jgi:hypothetical protein
LDDLRTVVPITRLGAGYAFVLDSGGARLIEFKLSVAQAMAASACTWLASASGGRSAIAGLLLATVSSTVMKRGWSPAFVSAWIEMPGSTRWSTEALTVLGGP